MNVEHPLGALHRLLRELHDLFRAGDGFANRIGNHVVGQPEFDRALRANAGARQRKLLGQQQTDMQGPGQRPAIGGHQPHLHVWVRKIGALSDVDDVAQRDQAAAEPHSRAIYRGHHGNSAPRHAQHDLAPVSDGLGPQVGVVRQLLEIPEIAAGRKRPAGSSDHRGAGRRIVGQSLPYPREPGMQVVVDRIERVRAVQGDDPQRTVGADVDFSRHVVHVRLPIPRFVKR